MSSMNRKDLNKGRQTVVELQPLKEWSSQGRSHRNTAGGQGFDAIRLLSQISDWLDFNGLQAARTSIARAKI